MTPPHDPHHASGTGSSAQTSDGSSIEFYQLLQPHGEPELIPRALEPGASILELGSGVGRITHPLLAMGFAMGFKVVAVDNSAEMLAHVHGATTIRTNIETLRRDRRFDAVLLASHFINMPSESTRQAMLATCRHHLQPSRVALIQRHDANWLKNVTPGL